VSLDQPRVAMLSVHTSPLDQPGIGDAGGMNVYITDLAQALARRGAQVEIFTRATSSRQPETVPMADGVLVRHVPAGPYEGLDKNELPGQLCAFTAGVLRVEAARRPGWYDVIHSHYWLSGQVGWLAAERWDVPLVHTMHTLAKVKNAALAPGDRPEPRGRIIGEEQVVAAADGLVASTAEEASDLVRLYDADPADVHVVAPGVDLELFHPDLGERGPGAPSRLLTTRELEAARRRARAALGLPADEDVVLFAGRVQPLKAPDVLVRALGRLRERGGRVPRLVVLGGPSGNPEALADLRALAYDLGVADRVDFRPPVVRTALARWYRAADVVAVPSRSESFGLVAAEAQACGTPVVAAAVGGLRTVVVDGVTGALVPGHDPRHWAATLAGLLGDPTRRAALGVGAVHHARRLGWESAAEAVVDVYDVCRRRMPSRATA
jgi:D-inositol-3-phosphate glycosyltransferase